MTGVTYATHSNGKMLGVRVGVHSLSGTIPAQFRRASDVGGFMPVTGYSNGQFTTGSLSTSGYFLPVPTSMIVPGGTLPGCEGTAQGGNTSPLITCVTERTGTQAYTDASPSSNPVGAFNAGRSHIDNYSEDGKCYTSGRELPAIIPLTNSKATLTDFFNNQLRIGGATPGHIGTAWAWYMLSPNWSTVFTGSSMPTAYNQQNVLKVAVLMTDGQYNIHYAPASARDQALELCTNMKAAGVTVYTVGFGFDPNTAPNASGTSEAIAKDTLQRCASQNSMAFFPYDGAALRTFFQQIGNQLKGQLSATTSKLVD